jgi:hypothetical protein
MQSLAIEWSAESHAILGDYDGSMDLEVRRRPK